MNTLTRRKLIIASLGSAGALAAGYLGWRSFGDRDRGDALVKRTGHALGTHVSITVAPAGQEADRINAALDAAFAELDKVEDVLSIYRVDSQVSKLNRDGVVDQPHPYLTAVLRASLAMSARTGGAFDVTVQPLWQVYAEAARQGATPDDAALDAARRRVDYRRIEVSDNRIRFAGSTGPSDSAAAAADVAITFNGIAQGFAVDRVKAVLQSHSIEHALLDLGELGALGDKQAGAPWKVGIQHPRDPEAFVAVAKMDGRSLATSGDYATAFSADRSSNHVFDPRTGRSPTEFASVSIVAETAMAADAMSTAVFVLGYEKGMDLVRQTPNCDALFVFKDGRTLATPGFPRAAT